MSTDQGASAKADRAATLSEPSQSSVVSGVAGIPCAAHTPAPWRIDGLGQSDGWGNQEGEDRCEIACLPHPTFDALEIFSKRSRDDFAEHEANARLIAAAPELYEACRLFEAAASMSVFDDASDAALSKALDAAEAALAKARGQ